MCACSAGEGTARTAAVIKEQPVPTRGNHRADILHNAYRKYPITRGVREPDTSTDRSGVGVLCFKRLLDPNSCRVNYCREYPFNTASDPTFAWKIASFPPRFLLIGMA